MEKQVLALSHHSRVTKEAALVWLLLTATRATKRCLAAWRRLFARQPNGDCAPKRAGAAAPLALELVTLCGLALGLLHPAKAETPALDELVVTASKSAQSVRTVPSNIAVLPTEALQAIGHVHINEAMQRVAGVWISRGNGQEHLTAIRSPVLTGAGSCGAFLMAQDGVPLRSAGFCNVNELLESASELAERIEVVRGPGSATHGSNALHGVVNIITPGVEAGLRQLRLEAGPYDYYRGRLALSSARLRLDVTGASDGGYKDDSGFGQQKLLLTHQTAMDKLPVTTSLAVTNLNQETAGFIQGHEAYKDAGLRRSNPNPEAHRDVRAIRLVSTITTDWGGAELKLRPYLRSVESTFLQHFLPGQPVEEQGQDSIGFQAHLSDASGSWVTGLELELTQGYLQETQEAPTQGSAFLVATIPTGKHYDYEVDATLAAAFAEYRAGLGDNLSLIVGARYEFMQYDYDNLMLAGRTRDDGTPCSRGGCRFNRPADRKDSFSNASPRLGLIYELGAAHQWYGQLARGFRAPQATELYRLQGGQQISNIDPEQLDSVEVGFRGSTDALSYDLSLFAMRKDNFIFRDTARQNVDNGETSHQGVEASIQWQLTESLEASWAFTYARHRYENNPALSTTPLEGKDIDTAPRTLGSANLAWTPSDRHRLELEWVHIGKHYIDPQNEHRYEGHDLLHLRGSWQASERHSVFYRVMNLANRDYAERADYGFGSYRYFVGTPLGVYLGVELGF